MSNARKLADNLPTDGQLGNRNIIINGKFEVDQRHAFASHTVSAGSDFFADRWGFYTNSGAFAQYGATSQVVSDAPTGFEKSLKWTTTSSGTIPATGEVLIRQPVEGYNISHVDYGSSTAKELTLSFYVKSSIAGNYGFTAQYTDSGGTNRYNLRSYTVNSANTWEFKTISIPANTANALQQKTNGAGLRLNWDLGEGTDYSGTVTGNWQTTYVNGLNGGVKIADNNGATWQVTGVQLEVGSQSTPFEHEPYETTLRKCERYHQRFVSAGVYPYFTTGRNHSSTVSIFTMHYRTEMRSNPSMTVSDVADIRIYDGNDRSMTGFTINGNSTTTCGVNFTGLSSGTGNNNAAQAYFYDNVNGYVALDAEL